MKMPIKEEDQEIDIFVATRIGSFKHVKYHSDPTKNSKKCVENLIDIKTLQKDEAITCMEWGNKEQTEILIGRKNQQIQLYNTDQSVFTKTYTADFGTGHVVGLGCWKRKLLAALSGGVVKIWSKKDEVLVDTGGKLDHMTMCRDDDTLFATGGEENDLKIYRIGEPQPTFVAKNLPQDWLQLRQPVWVSGAAFLPNEGGALAAVCSRHGYVRLYDTRAQRRPVCNVALEKMPGTCIAPSFDSRQVLVGFGRGQLHQVDLRIGRLDKGFVGSAGAVTSVAAVSGPSGPRVFSVGLDRHLRIHCFDTKKLLHKQYLTSKLSCVLVQSETNTPLRLPETEIKEEVEEVADDLDQLFDNMETVGDKPKRKLPVPESNAKKNKPSLEGSTIDLDNSEVPEEKETEDKKDTEDAIKKLLRSTEKQKRRMEKKKKEKKSKSVFHNA